MSKVYMGQIMAECDCQHSACEQRGYAIAMDAERKMADAMLAEAREATK